MSNTVFMLGEDTKIVTAITTFECLTLESNLGDKEAGLRVQLHVHTINDQGHCETVEFILNERATVHLLERAMWAMGVITSEEGT